MTDTGAVNEVMPKNRKEYKSAFYRNKIQQNPDFYAQEKLRIKEYKKTRYASDPEYADRMRASRRASYAKSKQAIL
jgi:hypothetical protein